MAEKRRTLTPEFKAKVALKAVRGEKTINEIAKMHQVHPGQITQWKKELLAGVTEIFNGKQGQKKATESILKQEEFYLQQIGTLHTQVEWLKKRCNLSVSEKLSMIDPTHPKLSLPRGNC